MAVPKDPGRYRDDPDSDEEREHGSVDRRMNLEKRAGCGADDQRDKHSAQSAVLFAGQGSIIGPIAGQEDECSGGSGRKYAPNVKLANSGALVPHRQRPDGKKNGNKVVTGPAAGRNPDSYETEMRQ